MRWLLGACCRFILLPLLFSTTAFPQVFMPPVLPPETRYTIDVTLDASAPELTGSGSAIVKNTSKHELRAIEFEWQDEDSGPFELTIGGTTRQIAPSKDPIEVLLPAPLHPGAELKLAFRFRSTVGNIEKGAGLQRWFPRLWWGYQTHAAYDVGISAPPDLLVASSARLDPKSGRYRAEQIATFGLFFGRGFESAEVTAGATQVRSIFRPAMRECAGLVLKTAADSISFYRQRFGMYPQQSFTIIPGSSQPYGGYPYATGIVVIHGQEECSEKPDTHWRWIASHEVAHQYWAEHVLAKEPEQGWGWLMIGLGIWADREYARTHGMENRHPEMLQSYADTVRNGLNTTIEISPEELRNINYDYNTQVTHWKGFGIISALSAIVGRDTFDRIYQRALREYAGRRLDVADFRHIAEEESGQDLGWFFVPMLRSSSFASYEIANKTSTAQAGSQITRLQVNTAGSILLPVPVEARFSNGERKRVTLDRTRKEQTIEFSSTAPMSEILIDPDHEFPLVIPPPGTRTEPVAGSR